MSSQRVGDRRGARAASSSFHAYGVPFSVGAEDRELLEQLLAGVPPGAAEGGGGGRQYETLRLAPDRVRLSADGETIADDIHPALLRLRFEEDLDLFVARHARERIFVRCGVVEWQGRAILLAGEPGWGTSTLVGALIRHGARFLSCSYALLDEAGDVHPFPRLLRLTDPDGTRVLRSPEELGAERTDVALPVGVVAFVRHEPGAHWDPQPITSAEAVRILLGLTPCAPDRVKDAARTISRAVLLADALSSVRGEADVTARLLLARV